MVEVRNVSEKQYEVKSGTDDKWYTVFVDRGKYSCTCRDFVFRGMARPCKHIKAVLDNLKENATGKQECAGNNVCDKGHRSAGEGAGEEGS